MKGDLPMLATYQQALRCFSREVRLFLATCALAGFAYFGIYALLLNLYLLRLGYNPAFVGLLNAVGPLALAVGSLPAGALSQHWGSRRALLVGFSLMMLGFGLLPLGEFMPVATRAAWLLATYLLAWLGAAFFNVTAAPFLMGATNEQERNHAFAIQSATFPLAGFVGNLVGGLLPGALVTLLGITLQQPAPYRYALWLAAALLLPALLAIWAMRPANVAPPQTARTVNDAPPYTLILILVFVFLLRTAGQWVMSIFFNVYLDAGLHVPTALIGLLGAAWQLLGVAALCAPWVTERWGARLTIGWGTVGMTFAFLPLILLPHWAGAGLGYIGMVALASLSNPVFGLFCQESVAPRWRNLLASVMAMTMGVSVAGVGFGGGQLIVTLGYSALFLGAAGLTLLGAFVFFAYFHQPRQPLGQLAVEGAV